MRKILQRNEKVELNSFIEEFVKIRQKYFTPGQEWLEAELAEEKISVYMCKDQFDVWQGTESGNEDSGEKDCRWCWNLFLG